MADTFVAYPSTPAFVPFKKDYLRARKAAEADGSALAQLPSRGKFLGTVKLHGTNATIVFRDNNKRTPQFQSRSRVIDTKTDNCGTVAHLSRAPLHELVDQILQIHGAQTFKEIMVAGEMAGTGIMKGVAIAYVPRFFAVFNIRIDGAWVDMRRYASVALPLFRIFNIAAWPTFEVDIDFTSDTADVNAKMSALTDDVVRSCSVGLALAGEAQPAKAGQAIIRAGEGIVWTLVESLQNDVPLDRSKLYNFKTKGEAFATTARAPKVATTARAPKVAPSADEIAKAQAFAQYALAERRFEQGVEFVEQELVVAGRAGETPYQYELLPKFTKWVIEDVMKEERYMMDEMSVDEKLARKAMYDVAKPWFAARVSAESDRTIA